MMKQTHEPCDPEALNRFFDQESEPKEHARIRTHLSSCPMCRETLGDYRKLSECFAPGFEGMISRQFRGHSLEADLIRRIRGEKPAGGPARLGNLAASGKFLVPAMVMCAMFLFFYFFPTAPVPTSGPSAIINSFSGDTSSVMIMETPESRQTIIWFNEKLKTEDQNEADHRNNAAVGYLSHTDTDRPGPGRA